MVVGCARFRQRRLGRSLHRQRHVDASAGGPSERECPSDASGGAGGAPRVTPSGGGAPQLLIKAARDSPADDLDGFFWRQVVARSPLTRVPGTPYDDAWRAINQLLI